MAAKLNLELIESYPALYPNLASKLKGHADHLQREISTLEKRKKRIQKILDSKPIYNEGRSYD